MRPSRKYLATQVVQGEGVFIAPGAVVVGQVSLGARSSIWYHAVLRGDLAPITVGAQTNIQDGAVLHVDPPSPVVLGDRVVVGHRAVIHGARVEDECLIGMGAVLLDDVVVGRHSVIGAGAVVTARTIIPPRSLVLGIPARVVRTVPDTMAAQIRLNAARYAEAAARYLSGDLGRLHSGTPFENPHPG
ncbi:MAG: gamma carbonic anhydrase family protein [Acidobacteriota bacterium]